MFWPNHGFRYPFARQPGFDFMGSEEPVTLPIYRWVIDMQPSLASSTAAQGRHKRNKIEATSTAASPVTSAGRTMRWSNVLPRITAATDYPPYQAVGEIVDSHSNVVVEVNGTFFLYGEYHANGHNEGPGSPVPKLSVYGKL